MTESRAQRTLIKRRWGIVVALALSLVVSGCTSEDPDPEASPSPTLSASASPSAAGGSADAGCPDATAAVTDPELRVGGSLEGDVDGDGAPEEVFLAADPEGEPTCRFFLVVETAAGSRSVAIEEEGLQDVLPEQGLPRMNALVDLDGEPGREIIVDLLSGASTAFVGIWTDLEGELHRVGFADSELFADVIPYGGSVGHIEAVDCAQGGDGIVLAAAVPFTGETPKGLASPLPDDLRPESAYLANLFSFELDDAVLRQTDAQTLIDSFGRLTRSHPFNSSPFGSCPGAA